MESVFGGAGRRGVRQDEVGGALRAADVDVGVRDGGDEVDQPQAGEPVGHPPRASVGAEGALVRTVLMLLLLPAVVWNRDTQPLHDVVAGTAVITV